jgi:hypothetical protein
MYGEFNSPRDIISVRGKRETDPNKEYYESDFTVPSDKSNLHDRQRRATRFYRAASSTAVPPPLIELGNSNKTDVCESKTEVVTPYWASNSAGQIRAIVNTQHFEQAIYQEMCQP